MHIFSLLANVYTYFYLLIMLGLLMHFFMLRYLTLCCQSVKARKLRNRLLTKVLIAVFSWSMSIGILSPVILYANTLELDERV